jgi:hypothetical protein
MAPDEGVVACNSIDAAIRLLFSPQRRRERKAFFSFVGERSTNENPQALRAEFCIKLTIKELSKDLINSIQPEGRLYFTFWRPCHVKCGAYLTGVTGT